MSPVRMNDSSSAALRWSVCSYAACSLGAERATVAARSVEVVVDPLRHLEERRVAFDHDPAGVDSDAADVREQGLEELGDTAAGRGGVDVHDPAPGEAGAGRGSGALEVERPLGPDQLLEPLRVEGVDVDLVEHSGPPRASRRCLAPSSMHAPRGRAQGPWTLVTPAARAFSGP